MYETITYEVILQRMIGRVINKNPNLDTREGSIIYDALAPAALELQNMYIELDVVLNETFADTASRESLIKRAAERGIVPLPATNAILKGRFVPTSLNIPIGSRFNCNDLNYSVTKKIIDGEYELRCEAVGTIGNANFGDLIPIQYIQGLENAELTEMLIPGENEEETESLRERYFDSLESEAFGGNIADYKSKVNAIQGVGGVKVYPVWNGGGTVKLVIINSEFEKPSTTLVDTVQTKIDPTQNQGKGVGIAPIDHVVTVQGVQETVINIATNITYQDGFAWENVKPHVEKVIDDYFKELASTWENSSPLIIRISQIEIRLLNVRGIVDISNTAINGVEQNYILSDDNIPIRGDVSG